MFEIFISVPRFLEKDHRNSLITQVASIFYIVIYHERDPNVFTDFRFWLRFFDVMVYKVNSILSYFREIVLYPVNSSISFIQIMSIPRSDDRILFVSIPEHIYSSSRMIYRQCIEG